MVKTFFRIIFTNDLNTQKVKVKNVLEYLKNVIPSIDEDNLYDLRVIYTELITNAIVHGNKKDLTKKVDLFIKIDHNLIKSIVKDEGAGFDYISLYRPDKAKQELFSESGRGLKLVLGLADFVMWNDIGNEILFHKKIY